MSGLVHSFVRTMWITTFITFLCVSHLNGIQIEYDDLLTKFNMLETKLLSTQETYNQRIDRLETIVKEQHDRLSDQENTILQQQQKLTEQNKMYKTLRKLYNEQAERIKQHEDILGTELAKILSLEIEKDLSSMIARTNNTSSAPGRDNRKQNAETYSDNDVVPTRNPSITSPVAFTAVKRAKQDGIGINQNIVFENIILNDGGGFHALNSIFIAPVAGYYLFSTSTLHDIAMPWYLHACIMHNGKAIAMAHSHKGIYDQGAMTVVLKLAAGDEVWISNFDHGPESVEGNLFSSFCGVLLYMI